MLKEIKTSREHYFVDEHDIMQGEYKEYWPKENILRTRCHYVNDKLHGEFNAWYRSGGLKEHCFFNAHRLHGECKQWYENGQLSDHVFYDNHKLHGEFKRWHSNGQIYRHCFFVNDRSVSFEEIPLPVTPEDRMYFTLKYNLLLIPVETPC